MTIPFVFGPKDDKSVTTTPSHINMHATHHVRRILFSPSIFIVAPHVSFHDDCSELRA